MSVVQNLLKQFRKLERYVDRPWYPFILAGCSLFDFLLAVVPVGPIAVAAAMARPKRWLVTATAMTIGSIIGGTLLAILTRHYGEPFINWIAPGLLQTHAWQVSKVWVEHWGFWAVLAVAASPMAQQPSVLIAALSKMPLVGIAAGLAVGKFIKFIAYTWIGSHAPGLLSKIPGLKPAEVNKVRDPAVEEPPI